MGLDKEHEHPLSQPNAALGTVHSTMSELMDFIHEPDHNNKIMHNWSLALHCSGSFLAPWSFPDLLFLQLSLIIGIIWRLG